MGVEGRGRIGQGSRRADGHKVWLLGQLETILFFSSSCCHPGEGRVGPWPAGWGVIHLAAPEGRPEVQDRGSQGQPATPLPFWDAR